jgi:hypothetical protein
MRQRLIGMFAVIHFLLLGMAPSLSGQSLSPDERQKIEALIKYISEMNDARFLRNSSTYDAKTAANFLRRKWAANNSDVNSARDFIDKIATFSGTSGKPYVVRFKDGREAPTREILLVALKDIERKQN